MPLLNVDLSFYRTETRGWGLKSSADIQKGQFVIEYVGEVVDEEEFKRRMKRKYEAKDNNYYFLTIDKDRIIDAGPKGNLARYLFSLRSKITKIIMYKMHIGWAEEVFFKYLSFESLVSSLNMLISS